MRTPRLSISVALLAGLLSGCQNSATDPPTAPAGNGISALSADEIVSRMAYAFDNASSLHMVADITAGGTSFAFDLRQRDHFDGTCTGTINGANFDVIRIAPDVYVRADDELWQTVRPFGDRTASLIPKLHGKYLKADAYAEAVRALSSCLNLPQVNSRSFANAESVIKGATTINGTPVIRLDQTEPGASTLYVAAVGEPVPIRIEAEGDEGGIDYSDYNEPVDVTAPPADLVVEIASLT